MSRMPYKKRGSKKRPTRRYGGRPMYKRRVYGLGQKSFKILRWSSADTTNNCHLSVAGNDAIPATDGATLFAMSNVNGSGELVSLFDNFRVLKVLYRWVIVRNPDQVTTTVNKGLYPRIVWTHDFNDSTPIARNLIYQRANLKEAFLGDNYQKTRWFSLRPAILTTMYESGVANAYQPTWRKWIDTADNATPHYGIKYSVDQNYTGMSVRLEAKILMECKGVS